MSRITSLLSGLFLISAPAFASQPMTTSFNSTQCEGSATPYPIPSEIIAYPDSLKPIMINHVSRHGARFPSSAKRTTEMRLALMHADSIGTITDKGRQFLDIVNLIMDKSKNQWGALDSLGMAEQRGIAARMYTTYPQLFDNSTVHALSSYAPRCIMSMYSFTHQLARMNNHIKIYTSSGRQNSPLMRPFDLDADYLDYRKEEPYKEAYEAYFRSIVSPEPARRILGENYPLDDKHLQDITRTEFAILAGMSAMGLQCDILQFFTEEEMNRAWEANNLSQYLTRTANTFSSVPAEIAADLLENLISTTDDVVTGNSDNRVQLRFGHAETMMPLLSLMRLKGCYYLTNYFDTVASHWHNFYVVPMASNLQIILFRSAKGKTYARFDLNEVPVPLLPDSEEIYIPWERAKSYLNTCLPEYRRL